MADVAQLLFQRLLHRSVTGRAAVPCLLWQRPSSLAAQTWNYAVPHLHLSAGLGELHCLWHCLQTHHSGSQTVALHAVMTGSTAHHLKALIPRQSHMAKGQIHRP